MATLFDNANLPEIKVCSKCRLPKPLSNYAKGKAHCRLCYNKIRRLHYTRPEVHVIKTEKRRAYERQPEIIAKRKAVRSRPEIKAKEKQASMRWRSRPEIKERMRQYTAEYNAKPESRVRTLFASVKWRANKKKLPFNLTEEWIKARVIDSNICELTGIKFEYGKPLNGWGKHPFAPSVDQIKAGRGYTPENCRMVVSAINNGMGEWGDDIFAQIASAFLKKRRMEKPP